MPRVLNISLFFAATVLTTAFAAPATILPVQKAVLKCDVTDLEQLHQLSAHEKLDVWSHATTVGSTVDVLVRDQSEWNQVQGVFSSCQIWIPDVNKAVENEADFNRQAAGQKGTTDNFHASYHSFDEIVAKLESWSTAHPDLVKFVPSIGKTTEGRDIPAIHVTSSNSTATKKKIWFNGGIHAREWISSATLLYIFDQFVNNYGTDAAITDLLNTVEYVVTPACNPDGYEYSRSDDRLWRKNRGSSGGVDLNRNFPYKWGGSGSSGSPDSETYRGPTPASEVETQALINYITPLNIDGGIDFHSYSQLVLRSWGYTDEPSSNEAVLKQIGDGIRAAIKASSNQDYASMKAADLYVADGLVQDWVSGDRKATGFTIELRPKSTFGSAGFVLPPSEIVAVGKEQLDAVKYFSKQIVSLNIASVQ